MDAEQLGRALGLDVDGSRARARLAKVKRQRRISRELDELLGVDRSREPNLYTEDQEDA